jgi:ribosomal protein L37AE/L43A
MIKLKRPDYQVGQTVETEINSFDVKTVDCPACENTGHVRLKDDIPYGCPRCKRKGTETISTPCKKAIQMTVRTITMVINKHGMEIRYECINEGRLQIYGENELRKAT